MWHCQLSILYVRFTIVAKLFWGEIITFNSLCEIPGGSWRSMKCKHFDFQFSMWDSQFRSTAKPFLCSHFQFSMWDSRLCRILLCRPFESLSILYVRFESEQILSKTMIKFYFQFSMWDSNAFKERYKSDYFSFNSLCEIPHPSPLVWCRLGLSILYVRFFRYPVPLEIATDHFQFSMWDSVLGALALAAAEATFNSLCEILDCCHSNSPALLPFNSLCEIPSDVWDEYEERRWPFNSLCEILFYTNT